MDAIYLVEKRAGLRCRKDRRATARSVARAASRACRLMH
jgi:hypothetical protein